MSLFVGNLYLEISLEQLQQVFSKFGNCKIDLKVGTSYLTVSVFNSNVEEVRLP